MVVPRISAPWSAPSRATGCVERELKPPLRSGAPASSCGEFFNPFRLRGRQPKPLAQRSQPPHAGPHRPFAAVQQKPGDHDRAGAPVTERAMHQHRPPRQLALDPRGRLPQLRLARHRPIEQGQRAIPFGFHGRARELRRQIKNARPPNARGPRLKARQSPGKPKPRRDLRKRPATPVREAEEPERKAGEQEVRPQHNPSRDGLCPVRPLHQHLRPPEPVGRGDGSECHRGPSERNIPPRAAGRCDQRDDGGDLHQAELDRVFGGHRIDDRDATAILALPPRGRSSIGRALPLQGRGCRFDPGRLHRTQVTPNARLSVPPRVGERGPKCRSKAGTAGSSVSLRGGPANRTVCVPQGGIFCSVVNPSVQLMSGSTVPPAAAVAEEGPPRHWHKFAPNASPSPHASPSPQRFACPAFMACFRTDRRGIAATLADLPDLRRELGLSHVPQFITPQKNAARPPTARGSRRRRSARNYTRGYAPLRPPTFGGRDKAQPPDRATAYTRFPEVRAVADRPTHQLPAAMPGLGAVPDALPAAARSNVWVRDLLLRRLWAVVPHGLLVDGARGETRRTTITRHSVLGIRAPLAVARSTINARVHNPICLPRAQRALFASATQKRSLRSRLEQLARSVPARHAVPHGNLVDGPEAARGGDDGRRRLGGGGRPAVRGRPDHRPAVAAPGRGRRAASGEPTPRRVGARAVPTKLTPADLALLASEVDARPGVTLRELAARLGSRVAESTVCRALRRPGYRHKKSRWRPASN